MLKVYLKDPDKNYRVIKEFIQDCSIAETDYDACFKLFHEERYSPYEDLKQMLMFSLIKNSKSELLEKILGKEFTEAITKAFEQVKYSQFPIVDNNNGDIARVYIFEGEFESICFPNTPQFIRESLIKLKKLINKNFFVCFDKIFTGNSFELALASCFYVEDIYRNNFIYTGSVDSFGKVNNIDYIKLKKKIALDNKKFLVSHIDKLEDLSHLNKDVIDLPFIQLFGKSHAELERNFNYLKDKLEGNILNMLEIDLDDLSIYRENFIQNNIDEWECLIDEFYYKISKAYNCNLTVRFHFICSLSAFAFSMGVIIGAKKQLSIYHFQDGKYFEVINFTETSLRKLKQIKQNFEYISYGYESSFDSDELMVCIYAASHNPIGDAKKFINETLHCNLLTINIKDFQGNISIDNSNLWVEITREIYSCINSVNNKQHVSTYHFIFSAPVPLSFALGMAIGDYKRLVVYNFDKSDLSYKKVIDSEKVKKFRNFF